MLVTVGRIGRPHGIRGEVTVEVRTDEPERYFLPDATVLVNEQPVVIDTVRWNGARLALQLQGVVDRNAAELLRGAVITAERDDDVTPDEPDTYYDASLVGCAVVDPGGRTIGEVSDVLHLPGQDVLVVLDAAGKENLIPFVAEFVPEVDLDGRRIVIDPPPGLLEA